MSDAAIRRPMAAPRRRRKRFLHSEVYPLQTPLFVVGAALGLICLVWLDWLAGLSIFALFAIVGASWRSDMLPIVPACLTYQWLSAATGYFYYKFTGYYPGGGQFGAFQPALLYSLLGLISLAGGMRVALAIFHQQVTRKSMAPPTHYNLVKVFMLTIAAFAISYMFNIVPRSLWASGAQIIENLLALRFVPYFLLVVTVFERNKGYPYLLGATAWVLGPQLLTGFSDFKEILLVLVIGALFQWKPWVRTPEQKRRNRKIMVFGTIGTVVALFAGIIWTGGVKQEWRDRIWVEGAREVSPVEKLSDFFDTVVDVTQHIDLAVAGETFVGRISSSELYFGYVIDRVPSTIPHEQGKLISRSLLNAVQPRFLFPNKEDLGGDSWLVQTYAGVAAAGNERGASIGLGYMPEFYIDFGPWGVAVFSFFWGAVGGCAIVAMSYFAPTREIFLALVVGLVVAYFMSFGGSFIKLFAGLVQRTIIASFVFFVAGKVVLQLMTTAQNRRANVQGGPRQLRRG